MTEFTGVMERLVIDLPKVDAARLTISEPEPTASDACWRARISVPVVDPSGVLIAAAGGSDAATYDSETSRLSYDYGHVKARTAAEARQKFLPLAQRWLKHLLAQIQSLEKYNEDLSSVVEIDIEGALTAMKYGH